MGRLKGGAAASSSSSKKPKAKPKQHGGGTAASGEERVAASAPSPPAPPSPPRRRWRAPLSPPLGRPPLAPFAEIASGSSASGSRAVSPPAGRQIRRGRGTPAEGERDAGGGGEGRRRCVGGAGGALERAVFLWPGWGRQGEIGEELPDPLSSDAMNAPSMFTLNQPLEGVCHHFAG
uniref:Uncharacterized protein n=1 Tax=Oryza nivara TaxID=4536 RepID=A0A0E0IQ57_ORYNI